MQDFPRCVALLNKLLLPITFDLATLRFDKVNNRGKDCRMTSKGRKGGLLKGVYGGRKGSQRNHCQLAHASKGKVVDSSALHSAMIRHHCPLSDRSYS